MARVPRSADQRLADLPVPVLGAIGFAVVLLGVGGVLTGHTASDANPAAMPVALAAGFTPLGVFVLRRRPGHPVGGSWSRPVSWRASRPCPSRGRPGGGCRRADEPYAVMTRSGGGRGQPATRWPSCRRSPRPSRRAAGALRRRPSHADDGRPTTAAERGGGRASRRVPMVAHGRPVGDFSQLRGGRASGSPAGERRCSATWPTRRRWPPRRAAARWTCSGRATGSSWPARRSAAGCGATCTTAWAPRWPGRGCSPMSCAGPSSTTRRARCWRRSRRTSRPAAPRSGS